MKNARERWSMTPTTPFRELLKRTGARLRRGRRWWCPECEGKTSALSEVEPETGEWLWRNRIPLGKITLLDGDPGLGKSLLTLEIAARITTGIPFHRETEGISDGVVILTSEDGLVDTVRPWLEAAGADLSRIVAVKHA
jgi:hypothetical protein